MMDYILLFSKQFSTVLFFLFFVGIVLWTYVLNSKTTMENIRYLIFDEEEIRRMQ